MSIFPGPDSMVFGRSVQASREMLGRFLAREHPVDADLVVPVPDSGVPAATGFAEESGIPLEDRFDPQPLRGPHVYRTQPGDPGFRRQAEA